MTTIFESTTTLSDDQVLARVTALARAERHATEALVRALAARSQEAVSRTRVRIALRLLHAGAALLGACRVQPDRGRSRRAAVPAGARPARGRRRDADHDLP